MSRARLARAAVAAMLGAALLTAAAAASDTPAALLAAAEAMERFDPPACAEVTVETLRGGRSHREQALFIGRGSTLYVAFRSSGTRALLRARGKAVLVEGNGAPSAVPPGHVLAGTALTVEDLAPLAAGRLAFPQIVSESAAEVMVGGAPAVPSQYAFLVYVLDRAHSVPARVQGYIGVVNNLGRVRWNSGHVESAGHWRPTEIRVTDYHGGAESVLRLRWHSPAPVPASLLRPRGLRREAPAGCGPGAAPLSAPGPPPPRRG